MLIDFQYHTATNKLMLSIIKPDGSMELKKYDWASPYKYIECSPSDVDVDPIYKSWNQKSVKKVPTTYPDRYSVYEFIDGMEESEKNLIYGYAIPNLYFIDIETAKDEKGYSSTTEARCEVQSISIVYSNKVIVLGIDELSDHSVKRIIKDTNEYVKKFDVKYEFKYIKFNDEYDMLKYLFEKLLIQMPCITGWNFLAYDWKYLVNRVNRISKINYDGTESKIKMYLSSPTNRFEKVYGTSFEMPMHKLIYDYMDIYKKMDNSIKIKESASLDFVSENILGVKKIEVFGNDGKKLDLMQLYKQDFEKFVYYNVIDSILVQLIHKKMRYIEIIFAISSVAKISAMDTFSMRSGGIGSLAITEGVLRDRFRDMHNVVFFKEKKPYNPNATPVTIKKIEGGYVKEPVRGLNRWVACYDFASLYPTTQRQFYLAPENYLGQMDNMDSNCYIDFQDGSKQLIQFTDMVILGNGSVFLKRRSATIDMLESVYKERKADKKISLSEKDIYEHKTRMLEALRAEIV